MTGITNFILRYYIVGRRYSNNPQTTQLHGMVRTSVTSFCSLGREYSPTSRRHLPKMREVVVPQGGLLRELDPNIYLLFGR